jgi:hypothetical protein
VTVLTALSVSPVRADQYSDGRFSFEIDGASANDVAQRVASNLLIQSRGGDSRPVVARWPNVPCYRSIEIDDVSSRQLGDLIAALKRRLGLDIRACASGSPSAIAYYFVRGQISADEKRNILELVRPVQESSRQVSDFLREKASCYWHAHTDTVDGLFNITNAAVFVNLQMADADQAARCLFAGTAASLGLAQVVPPHEEAAPIDWGGGRDRSSLAICPLSFNLTLTPILIYHSDPVLSLRSNTQGGRIRQLLKQSCLSNEAG